MINKYMTVCIAIVCITLLETVALWRGINGSVFMTSIAAISGLGGYAFGKRKQ